MKKDIILSGVGGQGILSIAAIIGKAALNEGLRIKQAEVHGMSQRGGDVQSNLRISSEPIASDLIPQGGADIIISLEPMEALRYLPWLSSDGWVITNTTPFVNIPNYPENEALEGELKRLPHVVALDVDALARQAASPVRPTSCCWAPPHRSSVWRPRSSSRASATSSHARATRWSRRTSPPSAPDTNTHSKRPGDEHPL